MAGLIEQLKAEALQRSIPIADLLRKAKTAATQFDRTDFAG
jgi:hypothetical protein